MSLFDKQANYGTPEGGYAPSLQLPVNTGTGFGGFNPKSLAYSGMQSPGGYAPIDAKLDAGGMRGADGINNIAGDRNLGAGFDWKGLLGGVGGIEGLGKIGGGLMDAAGMYMNYNQMAKTNAYNDKQMDLLQEQQGLAKRAADVNYANQQSMAEQLA